MWSTLIGAVVGGVLAIAGSLAVELRSDRRRRIGAARRVYNEAAWNRAFIERFLADHQSKATTDPATFWREWEQARSRLRVAAWATHSSEFVAAMPYDTFANIDGSYTMLAHAVEHKGSWVDVGWVASLKNAEREIGKFAKPTWFDRHVWRL